MSKENLKQLNYLYKFKNIPYSIFDDKKNVKIMKFDNQKSIDISIERMDKLYEEIYYESKI